MKQALIFKINKRVLILLPAILFSVAIIPVPVFSQSDSTKKTAQVAAEEKELISPSLDLVSVQKGDNTIDLKAALSAKVNKVFYKFPLLKVTFFQVINEEEKELGFMITDRAGSAVFNYKPDTLITDADGKVHFKAVFAGNKSMDPADAEVTIKRARLELITTKEDSLYSVHVKLVEIISGKEIPVPEIILGVFVKRLFKPLKIGEGTTDTNGEASVEISNELPGNAKGDITLLAKLDENEIYGNMESGTTVNWGVPVSDKLQEAPRALWSAHPPVWMMVTFAVLMIVVWGHYFVIIFELFRLRKEEPKNIKEVSTA
jgi:hypothetical protein